MNRFQSAVVLFLGLYSVVHGEICIPGEKIVNTNRQSMAACLYSNVHKNLSRETIKMEVDNNEGNLIVFFPVHNNHTYTVSLYVKQGDCLKFDRLQCVTPNLHSTREFSPSRCETVDQQIIGSVTFSNIYTGCYIAKIRNTQFENLYSNTTAMTTNRENIRPQDIRPAMGTADVRTQDFNGTRNITAYFKDFAVLLEEKLPVHITLVQNVSCDGYDEADVLVRFSLGLEENDTLKCTQQQNFSPLQSCEVIHGLATVRCTFLDIVPGNYCLKIDPDDPDRCHKLSLYRGYVGCASKHTFVVEDELQIQEPKENLVKVSAGGLTLTMASLFLIISFVVAIIMIRRKDLVDKVIGIFPILRPSKPLVKPVSSPEVLLLYAQDNDDFMTLMAVFREVLSSVGNCKVHDIFHSDSPEIALNPGEWIQRLATNSNVKVIIVSSPCALSHQVAMGQFVSVKYCKPLPYSHLFARALHEVKFNRMPTYNDTFVIRFDSTDLQFVTSYARYQLPLHLSRLLTDLDTGIKESDLKNLKEDPLVQRLTALREKHYQYTMEHPDYVVNMFSSRISPC